MNKKKWEEIDRGDARPGDRVRVYQNGYRVDMVIAEINNHCGLVYRAISDGGITILRGATVWLRRVPKPKLPTKAGSIIIATKVRGVSGRWVMVRDDVFYWTAGLGINRATWHRDEHIEEWVLAKVKEVAR